MPHLLRLALVLFWVLASTSTLAQTNTDELRWVRGVVIANDANVLRLQLRGDKQLSIPCDTRCAAATPGSIVELHYVDRNDDRHGELLFADPSASDVSRRPGRSVRGTVLQTKRASVRLQVGKKKRTYSVEKSTALIDAGQPQPAATGRAVISRLRTGEDVLLKYEEHDSSIPVGDMLLSSSELRALEVRRLK